jgi:hypothetical protein
MSVSVEFNANNRAVDTSQVLYLAFVIEDEQH